MRKIHEIQTYLKDTEHLVNALKAELDLTRQLLFRTWLRNQTGLVIEENNMTVPDEAQFTVKLDEQGNSTLFVQNSIKSNYEKINNQLKELGFRARKREQKLPPIQFTTSRVVYEHVLPLFVDLQYESFYIMLLDNSNQLIKTVRISEGGISGTLVDPKKIYKIALDNYTSGMIISHNHPSGNLQPSESDKKLTKKIVEAGKMLDINVIDHLIIGRDGYFSFSDDGIM